MPKDWPEDEEWVVSEPQSIDPTMKFSTRERGLNSENIWRAFSVGPQPTLESPDGADDLYFRHPLDHSLGYLNRRSFGSGLRMIRDYEGDPQQPFPWITWNDRPYSNAYELLLVPSVSAPRLLWEYSFPSSGSAVGVDPYAVDDPKTIGEPTAFRSPYGHLFNFFQSSNSKGPGANFSRLLDYAGVPSKFLGTETWYNPEIFSQRRAFRPPFNRLSRFRDRISPFRWSLLGRGRGLGGRPRVHAG